MKIFVIALFALTYVLMLSIPSRRHYFAASVAAIYIALGVVGAGEAFYAVDWNIIMMLFGTMGTVYLFIESKMPNKIDFIELSLSPNFDSRGNNNLAMVLKMFNTSNISA
ncbi:MAG: hypothetical protein IKB62_08550, partial [Oscillospiraceae bacterium]|nr:hypothetical protein [Oscillospiraceae bacterium]